MTLGDIKTATWKLWVQYSNTRSFAPDETSETTWQDQHLWKLWS